MGIWDELRLNAGKLFNRNISKTPCDTNECRILNNNGLAKAVIQIDDVLSNGAEKLKQLVPDSGRREKIGRILTKVGMFTVDSTISESLKSVSGGIKLYKTGREGLKDHPPSSSHRTNANKKPDITIMMEEMQARMEKVQEDMSSIKQPSKVEVHSAEGRDASKEFSDEPIKELSPLKTDPKRVMIRSRL